MKRWIWQYENYPHFTYQFEKLEYLLQKISMEQGYLIALTQTLNQDTILQRQCDALLIEHVKKSTPFMYKIVVSF